MRTSAYAGQRCRELGCERPYSMMETRRTSTMFFWKTLSGPSLLSETYRRTFNTQRACMNANRMDSR